MSNKGRFVVPPLEDLNNSIAWDDKVNVIKTRKKGWESSLENVEEHLHNKKSQQAAALNYVGTKDGGAVPAVERITDFGALIKALMPKAVQMQRPPDSPRKVELKDFSSSSDRSSSMTKCCYCTKIVPIGGSLVNCQSCSVIAHFDCIRNIGEFHKKRLDKARFSLSRAASTSGDLTTVTTTARTDRSEETNTEHESEEARKAKFNEDFREAMHDHLDSPTKKSDIRWHCRFCIDELQKTNEFYQKKFVEEIDIYYLSKSCAKLQSFVKMFISRYAFRKFRRGIIKLQRLYRWQRLSYATRWRRANQKWPMRIRLHDIWMFAKTDAPYERWDKSPSLSSTVTLPTFLPIGEGISSCVYENNIGWNKKAGTDPIPTVSQPTIDILQNAHVDSPIYHRGQGNGQAQPRGTLFLTVVVNEMQSDGKMTFGSKPQSHVMSNQYRYDLPLKYPKALSAIKPSLLKQLGIDVRHSEGLIKNYKIACMTTPRPYILVPYVSANLDVQYILSEIKDWPKGVIIGRSTQHSIFSTLYNRRVVAYRQGIRLKFELHEMVDEELPVQEEGGKLSLAVFKPKPPPGNGYSGTKTTRDDSQVIKQRRTSMLPIIQVPSPSSKPFGMPDTPKSSRPARRDSLLKRGKSAPAMDSSRTGRDSGRNSSRDRSARGYTEITETSSGDSVNSANNSKEHYNPNQLSDSIWHGGVVTSSIISIDTHDGGANEAGFIVQLAQDILESSKKKMWCVLLDRVMMIYSVESGNKNKIELKCQLDLQICQVYMLASEIIRIRNSTETVHLHCVSLSEHEIWFKKIYEQSASAAIMCYSAYHKRHAKDNLAYGKSFGSTGALAASRSSLEKHKGSKRSAAGEKTKKSDADSKLFQLFPGLHAGQLNAPSATKTVPIEVSKGASSGQAISNLEDKVDHYLKFEKKEYVYNEEELDLVMSRPATSMETSTLATTGGEKWRKAFESYHHHSAFEL
jgi:ribosomal protein L44E